MEIILKVILLLSGSLLGLIVFLFVLPLMPKAVSNLGNNPNRRRNTDGSVIRPSDFGFFTTLAPGQVKIIEAGDRFIRCIMRFEGHTFKGMIKGNEKLPKSEKWEVVKVETGEREAHPVPRIEWISNDTHDDDALVNTLKHVGAISSYPFRALVFLWSRWVYRLTGYVFVGVWPFRRVHTYSIERIRVKEIPGKKDEVTHIKDYSDHFRVADFKFPVLTPEADTTDFVPVSVLQDNYFRVLNPYLAAYKTDHWADRITSAVKDCVNAFTRTRPLNEVLAAKQDGKAKELSTEMRTHLGVVTGTDGNISDSENESEYDDIGEYGVVLVKSLLLDIDVVESVSESKRRLSDVAFAEVDKKAQEIRAQGTAANLREQTKVVEERGEVGLAVLAAERDVRTAEAAGENAIVIVGSSNTDPIGVAALRELRALNHRRTE